MTARELRALAKRNGWEIAEYAVGGGYFRAVIYGPRNSGIRLCEADGATKYAAFRSLCRRVAAIRDAK